MSMANGLRGLCPKCKYWVEVNIVKKKCYCQKCWEQIWKLI